MQGSGFMLFWSVLAATVAALSLGPSFAHVLESGPRLHVWSPELWREATVFNQQFKLFLIVGAPLDIAAILAPAVLTYLLRGDSPAFGFALGTTVFFALALLAWFLVVSPANSVLATWTAGPIPDDFDAIRWRWEAGHMVVAGLKFLGFISLACSLVSMHRPA
jgi:hypothetical protein